MTVCLFLDNLETKRLFKVSVDHVDLLSISYDNQQEIPYFEISNSISKQKKGLNKSLRVGSNLWISGLELTLLLDLPNNIMIEQLRFR